MKIISKKERIYSTFVEKYELNGVYAGQKDLSIGTLLCFLLASDPQLTFESLSAEAEGEIGEEREILRVEQKDYERYFSDPKTLEKEFQRLQLKEWELESLCGGVEVTFSGRTYGTVIGVTYPVGKSINALLLLRNVESRTWEYHDYEPGLVLSMKNVFQLNTKPALRALIGLGKYPDIYAEFVSGLKDSGYVFPAENPVTEQGYNARTLHENYPLSELGAYNYLTYLRDEPEEALEDLKRGLPAK